MLSYNTETRSFRSVQPRGGNVVEGYAALYNTMSVAIGGFRETILPGAFAESIRGDIRALYDHETSQVLGRTRAGTLRLKETAKGLWFELDLPDNAIGNNAIISIRRGDVTGMSFGMTVPAGGERWYREGGQPIRELSKIKLLEISITAFPAYENTHVAIRHFHDWQHELRKMKQWLAEATL